MLFKRTVPGEAYKKEKAEASGFTDQELVDAYNRCVRPQGHTGASGEISCAMAQELTSRSFDPSVLFAEDGQMYWFGEVELIDGRLEYIDSGHAHLAEEKRRLGNTEPVEGTVNLLANWKKANDLQGDQSHGELKAEISGKRTATIPDEALGEAVAFGLAKKQAAIFNLNGYGYYFLETPEFETGRCGSGRGIAHESMEDIDPADCEELDQGSGIEWDNLCLETSEQWDNLYQETSELCKAGKLDQAIIVAKQALEVGEKLEVAEKNVSADDKDFWLGPAVAISLDNLVNLYIEQGEYALAEPFQERLLAIHEKSVGFEEDPYWARMLQVLAMVYHNQGKYAQAEPLYKRSLAIIEKAFNADHPSVAESLDSLAQTYRMQGKYTLAEPLYKRSMAIIEKDPDASQPDIAVSLRKLGDMYRGQGDYEQAEQVLKRALAIHQKALGPANYDVCLTRSSLSSVYHATKRYNEAAKLDYFVDHILGLMGWYTYKELCGEYVPPSQSKLMSMLVNAGPAGIVLAVFVVIGAVFIEFLMEHRTVEKREAQSKEFEEERKKSLIGLI